MKAFSRRSLLVAAIVAALLLLAFLSLVIYPLWWGSSHGFNLAGFEQIHQGMTMSQVEDLLGKPTLTELLEEGGMAWTYNKGHKWCIGHIWFDRNGRVKDKEHDH